MRLNSKFALLDVKRGRVGLRKRLDGRDDAELVEVVIHGCITGVWGHDDGESQEFTVEVDRVEVTE